MCYRTHLADRRLMQPAMLAAHRVNRADTRVKWSLALAIGRSLTDHLVISRATCSQVDRTPSANWSRPHVLPSRAMSVNRWSEATPLRPSAIMDQTRRWWTA